MSSSFGFENFGRILSQVAQFWPVLENGSVESEDFAPNDFGPSLAGFENFANFC